MEINLDEFDPEAYIASLPQNEQDCLLGQGRYAWAKRYDSMASRAVGHLIGTRANQTPQRLYEVEPDRCSLRHDVTIFFDGTLDQRSISRLMQIVFIKAGERFTFRGIGLDYNSAGCGEHYTRPYLELNYRRDR